MKLDKVLKRDFEILEENDVTELLKDFCEHLVSSVDGGQILIRDMFVFYLRDQLKLDEFQIGQTLNNVMLYLGSLK